MTLPLPSMMLSFVDLNDLLDLIPGNENGACSEEDDFVIVPETFDDTTA